MKICILGWYGTETLGDRAILDGIVKTFENKEVDNTFYLGSLIPFFSERTLYDDGACYNDGKKLKFEIFCEKDYSELKHYIIQSDYVIMGGGPIMDISEILIIRKAFRFARKHNIKTGLIGCGYGPFHNDYYKSIAEEILALSDVIIFRDEISSRRATIENKSLKVTTLCDPAIISALSYKEKHKDEKEDYIAVNFRDTRFKVYKDEIIDVIDDLYRVIKSLAEVFPKVLLVPMHTFFWGGDDRGYYAEILQDREIENATILYAPQSLYELYGTYSSAKGCIGMRYHSVILQTILNGNNIILDYTETNTGKISGFLSEIESDFYKARYINIDSINSLDMGHYINCLSGGNRYCYNQNSRDLIEKYIGVMF